MTKFNKNNSISIIGTSKYASSLLVNHVKTKLKTIGLNHSGNNYQTDIISSCEETAISKGFLRNPKPSIFPYVKQYHATRDNLNNFIYVSSKSINLSKHSNRLFFNGNSLHPVLNWCILQDYQNIFMIGINFEPNWSYFYREYFERKPDDYILKVRNGLYNFSKYLNLYCLHENTFDKNHVKTLSIEEFLELSE